jgi:hypothetical protein
MPSHSGVRDFLLHLVAVLMGFTISCVLGHFVVKKFLWWLSHRLGAPRDPNAKRTPPGLTGFLERVFFTIAVAVNATGVLPAMIAWLALKLAANWQYRDDINSVERTNYKFSAILAGLLSMLLAYIGGLAIQWWW